MTDEPDSDAGGSLQAMSSLVFILGVTQGVVPLLSMWIWDRAPLLALPARLPSPWWWFVSLAVIALSLGLLEGINRAKERGEAPG